MGYKYSYPTYITTHDLQVRPLVNTTPSTPSKTGACTKSPFQGPFFKGAILFWDFKGGNTEENYRNGFVYGLSWGLEF